MSVLKIIMIICTILLAAIGITAVCMAEYWRKRYRDEYNRHRRWRDGKQW